MANRSKTSIVIIGALLCASACGTSDSDSPATKEITRVKVSESSFAAPELEGMVDSLVTAIETTEPKNLKLYVNLKGVTGYWQPVVVGANRAMSELKAVGAVKAPPSDLGGDDAALQQAAVIKADREAGCDGIGIAPMNDSLLEEMQAAVAKKIPVVTIDSDLPESQRSFYLGTVNAEAGMTGGKTLSTRLPEPPGTVIVLGSELAVWKDGYDRTLGAKSVLEEAGYSVIMRQTSWDEGAEEADIASMKETIMTADPPVVGMIGLFSNAYRCAMAAEAAGKSAGEIDIAAFDFDANTVSYMRSGYISVTHAQRQYYMGYLAPYLLYAINVLGEKDTRARIRPEMLDDHRINTGMDVVEADRLDDYYSFLDELGIGGN